MRNALLLFVLPLSALAFRAEWQSESWIHLQDETLLSADLMQSVSLFEATATADTSEVKVHNRELRADGIWLEVQDLNVHAQHFLRFPADNGTTRFQALLAGTVLDAFVSAAPMGAQALESGYLFRLFAPRASAVHLHLYKNPSDDSPWKTFDAQADERGCFHVEVGVATVGMAWTWSLEGPHGAAGWASLNDEFADPWAVAVATRADYLHEARSLLLDPSFDWQDADYTRPELAAWVIYESHLKDLVAGEAAGADSNLSAYEAFSTAKRGGLAHLVDLGVTAVEFLPLQEFGQIEIDFENPDLGVFNTWNPWEHNHWGYMTSHFLAPESAYAMPLHAEVPAKWMGVDGSQVQGLKSVVNACHEAGIAVVMDVVYNHVSQYDRNCFKAIDPAYYFYLSDDGQYLSGSGCGNDFRTERPMARRLILDSVDHFVKAYHVDGFRFDLASMIDDETLRQLHDKFQAESIFHAAEPWGGGKYTPEAFAKTGWAWWNDQYRVDLRGRYPSEAAGLIFGKPHYESNAERFQRSVNGHQIGGYNADPLQAVNYIEAHDDHDLGDWLRLGLGLHEESPVLSAAMTAQERLEARLAFQTLSEAEVNRHRMAAFHLLTSAGIPMLHEGQEFARSKLIEPLCADDARAGSIDHNSYEKDNETNWIDWRVAEANAELLLVYKELISLRRSHPDLATAQRRLLHAEPERLSWLSEDYFCVMNFSDDKSEIEIPQGVKIWKELLAPSALRVMHPDAQGAWQPSAQCRNGIAGGSKLQLPPWTACLLKKSATPISRVGDPMRVF
jgi:pullulanase